MHFILLIIGIALIVLNIGIIKEEKHIKKENFNENLNIALMIIWIKMKQKL